MIAWAVTDTGMARRENQDCFRLEKLNTQITCVVCDGMGGARSGEVASTVAVETFMESMQVRPHMKNAETALSAAVTAANARVYGKAQTDPAYYGMGTTLVGAFVARGTAALVNVGDSRAYKIGAGGIEQITRDHSLVENLIERGELTREQAKEHPSKNLITRVVGTDEAVIADLFSVELDGGDFLLLCTDGLTNVVDDQEILFEVMHGGAPADCCERLVKMANKRGGPDNITIILIHI